MEQNYVQKSTTSVEWKMRRARKTRTKWNIVCALRCQSNYYVVTDADSLSLVFFGAVHLLFKPVYIVCSCLVDLLGATVYALCAKLSVDNGILKAELGSLKKLSIRCDESSNSRSGHVGQWIKKEFIIMQIRQTLSSARDNATQLSDFVDTLAQRALSMQQKKIPHLPNPPPQNCRRVEILFCCLHRDSRRVIAPLCISQTFTSWRVMTWRCRRFSFYRLLLSLSSRKAVNDWHWDTFWNYEYLHYNDFPMCNDVLTGRREFFTWCCCCSMWECEFHLHLIFSFYLLLACCIFRNQPQFHRKKIHITVDFQLAAADASLSDETVHIFRCTKNPLKFAFGIN